MLFVLHFCIAWSVCIFRLGGGKLGTAWGHGVLHFLHSRVVTGAAQ